MGELLVSGRVVVEGFSISAFTADFLGSSSQDS